MEALSRIVRCHGRGGGEMIHGVGDSAWSDAGRLRKTPATMSRALNELLNRGMSLR
jgi:hypothetical protein